MVLGCKRKAACRMRKPGKKVENVEPSERRAKRACEEVETFSTFFPRFTHSTCRFSLASQDHVIASLAEEELKSILQSTRCGLRWVVVQSTVPAQNYCAKLFFGVQLHFNIQWYFQNKIVKDLLLFTLKLIQITIRIYAEISSDFQIPKLSLGFLSSWFDLSTRH